MYTALGDSTKGVTSICLLCASQLAQKCHGLEYGNSTANSSPLLSPVCPSHPIPTLILSFCCTRQDLPVSNDQRGIMEDKLLEFYLEVKYMIQYKEYLHNCQAHNISQQLKNLF